ncbi:hypothetical protein [Neobacillus cucumis]|nr:hypothetical protein [Neobacillus cucumis]
MSLIVDRSEDGVDVNISLTGVVHSMVIRYMTEHFMDLASLLCMVTVK